MRATLFSILALTLLPTFASAQEDDARTWQYTVKPYLLASSIDGEAGVGRVGGIPIDISFSDILENLQMAGMLNFEAQHRNGWGMIFDYAFMDLGGDTSVGLGGIVDAGVRQGILEALASHRLKTGTGTLELLAGIRWWDNQVQIDFDPLIGGGSPSLSVDEGWVDPVVGLRWTNSLSDRWKWSLRGDIGGFGVGSDFSWSARATAFYHMTDRFDLEFGYMAVDVDYDNGKAADSGLFTYDATTHGPMVGLVIKF
jgi:hypothetical protein